MQTLGCYLSVTYIIHLLRAVRFRMFWEDQAGIILNVEGSGAQQKLNVFGERLTPRKKLFGGVGGSY